MFHRFEHRSQKVIPRPLFARRMAIALGLWAAVTAAWLIVGMAGYAHFGALGPADAFINAAMILSGMGPVDAMKTAGGKVFAGCYAIFSGLVLIVGAGFILGPLFHRVLHRFHVEGKGEE